MRLERLMRAVMNEPWLITPEKHHQIQHLFEMKLAMTKAEFQMRDREVEISGDKVLLDSMTIEGGVARIPFGGVLIKGAGSWEKWAGALSHDDVIADVNEAVADPNVRALFFDVDSPGGTAAGSFELADLVAAAADVKPTMAWVERLCCSAAFLAMSGAGMIYGSRTSEIGAVECYMAWVDSSVAFDRAGLKMEIIKNTGGTHVAAGMRGTSLSDEQRDALQEQVDQLFSEYVAHLEDVRPKVARSSMDGRTFIGNKGIEAGMFDAITTKEQAIKDLRTWAKLT